MDINIAYSLLEEQVAHTHVSMQSIIENNKNHTINFYLIKDQFFEETLCSQFEIYHFRFF